MTVEELTERLKEFDKNMEVVVQYRDDGGWYYGVDSDICLYIQNGKVIL